MDIRLREELVQTIIQTELIRQTVLHILLQEEQVQTTIQAEIIHNNKALQQIQTPEHEQTQTQVLKAAETIATHHHQEAMNILALAVVEALQAAVVHLVEEEDLQVAEEDNL